jgi:error-prone DNA polymerase
MDGAIAEDLQEEIPGIVPGITPETKIKEQRVSPLLQMTAEERLVADFLGTGMTVGPHPLAYHRAALRAVGVRSAVELPKLPDGMRVRVAGAVIARQRPGTAKGFVFLSLEDETGISNAIITPQLFEKDHSVVVHHPYLLIEGRVQNLENVTSVKAERVEALTVTRAESGSHDFH